MRHFFFWWFRVGADFGRMKETKEEGGEERRGEERRGEEKRRDFHFFKLFFGTKGNNFPALFES